MKLVNLELEELKRSSPARMRKRFASCVIDMIIVLFITALVFSGIFKITENTNAYKEEAKIVNSEIEYYNNFIEETHIGEYEDDKRVAGDYSELFSGYDDLTRVFECISELDEDYKKSSLKGTNIYMTDYNAMIKDVYMFWKPEEDGRKYIKGNDKSVSLSKGAMEKWFKGCFIERVHIGENVVYLSENETLHCIREASNDLDNMLEMAFEFDLYLKKHSEKIRKRLWKIQRFARLRLF